MTIICISGLSNASTQLTEHVLLTCGMSKHLPLERDPSFNIIRWHERVMATQQLRPKTHSGYEESAHQPSRLWQQLAIDLIVANMDSPNWGWAYPDAVYLLDFWSQLESDIRFVLICEDRLSLICRLIEQGEAPESMPGHLALWTQSHQNMLRFNLRNPAKSLLVWDAEVQTQPSNLIQQMQTNWQAPLDATLASPQTVDQPNPLLQKIALQILVEHPHTAALEQELQSVIGPSHLSSDSDRIEAADLMNLYWKLKDLSTLELQLSLAQEQQQMQSDAQLQEVQEKIKLEMSAKQDAQNKLAVEQKSSADLKKQRDEQAAAKQNALTKNKDLQEESDLLLAQLHQVQEELENYYIKHHERQIEVEKLQKRWLRAVHSHPGLEDFEVLELLSESSTDHTAHWRINHLKVEGVLHGPFEFKTVIENGVTGLVFSKDAKGLSPIRRWPLIAADETQLIILPIKGKDDPKKRSATILQLGTTDWRMVQELSAVMCKALGSAAMETKFSNCQALLEGLKVQQQILDKVPALLRFDDIQLLGQQNTDLKNVIGLRLTNADLQGLKVNLFEFQIQLNLAPNSTIASAHLIFDEKTAGTPFENWMSNVKSSSGQAVMALQLGPQGWNPQLWHTLSPLDQQWLQNTVRLLPFMLATLQNQGVKLEKGWVVWGQTATDMVHWSKLSVGLSEVRPTSNDATSSDTTPDKLLAPDAAPAPTKSPRKLWQASPKPAQSLKTKAPASDTKAKAIGNTDANTKTKAKVPLRRPTSKTTGRVS